jgi:hypothetical protein
MIEAAIYSHHLPGRRFGTLFALVFSIAMLGFGLLHQAPWYYLVPVWIPLAMLVWVIARNPQSGSVLTAQSLTIYYTGKNETVMLHDISSMTVTNWSDGPDTVCLTLVSGRKINIPSMSADSKLAPALRQLGVAEEPSRRSSR